MLQIRVKVKITTINCVMYNIAQNIHHHHRRFTHHDMLHILSGSQTTADDSINVPNGNQQMSPNVIG